MSSFIFQLINMFIPKRKEIAGLMVLIFAK